MRNRVSLSVAALVLFALPAAAQDRCVVPYAPTVPKGMTASREQILTARDQVTAFLKASEDYQSCLKLYLEQQMEEARRDPRNNSPESVAMMKRAIENRAGANQREKERTGTEFNEAVKAFNAAHPAAN